MNDKQTYSLCEAVADLAINFATTAPRYPMDSRETIRLVIEWAKEFEAKYPNADWGVDPAIPEYLDAIDAFFDNKYKEWDAATPHSEKSGHEFQ